MITTLLILAVLSGAVQDERGSQSGVPVSTTDAGATHKAADVIDRMRAAQKEVQPSSGVEITGISWRGAYCILGNCENKGVFSIDVKNTGTKTVTVVHWDFYLVDSVRQRVYDHFTFVTSDKKIAPGAKPIRLTKRFDYHDTPDYLRARAVVVKIIYSDGSAWSASER